MDKNVYGFETTRQSIVARIQNKEDGAWEKFWEQYESPIRKFLTAKIRKEGLDRDGRYEMSDADSCLGRIHDELYRKLPSYSGGCLFRACIMKCISQAIDDEFERLNPTGANARRIGLERLSGEVPVPCGDGEDHDPKSRLDEGADKKAIAAYDEGRDIPNSELEYLEIEDRREWVRYVGKAALDRAAKKAWQTTERAETVRLLRQGMGTGEIAAQLGIASQAVSKTKKALCDQAAEYMRDFVMDDPELGEVCGLGKDEFSVYLQAILDGD